MRLVRRDDRVLAIAIGAAAIASLLATSPLVGADNATWARSIIADTPHQIWASSHFGQVLNYAVLFLLTRVDPAFTPIASMRIVSYAIGLLYVAALGLLATTVPTRGRVAFFVIGVVSPLTVFLHGEEEIAYYPFPVLVLVAALWRRAQARQGGVSGTGLAALGGLAAALHGVGLFFVPGIIALSSRTLGGGRSLSRRVLASAEPLLIFFGANGALFILYVLAFPSGSIVPGDAGGGGQRTLFVPLFGTIPTFNEFREYSFFSLAHLQDVVMLLCMGAPALLVLGAVAVRARHAVAAAVRADAPIWVLAGCGIALVLFYYPGVSIFVTQSILVSSLALAQTLAALVLVSTDDSPWRRSFPVLLVVTVAATAFDWTHAGTNATGF